ncbi:hypothetical protein FOL47_008947 [Perkinsus chesapeaki]|uniref:Uncharacterized protein n=1 Tax=Perkinsus chesapeaki TaxID=330153 RepID=A0A7J6N1X0_PERCH|nr:hypothetical protein FOL47_008947 [Perkinsus chesapeaki]
MAPLVPVKPPRHVPVANGVPVRDGPVVPMVPDIPHGNIYMRQHLSRCHRSAAPTLENKRLEEIKWNNRVDELDARWRGNGFKGEVQYIPFVGRGLIRPLKRDIDLQLSTFAKDNMKHLNDTQMPPENALSALRRAMKDCGCHSRLPQLAAGLPSINPTLGTRIEALPNLRSLTGPALLDAWRCSTPWALCPPPSALNVHFASMPKIKSGTVSSHPLKPSPIPTSGSAPGNGMEIIVKERGSGAELTRLQLPEFCIDHMMMMSPEANLDMMIKHINTAIKPRTVGFLFLQGERCSGITIDDCGDGMILEIE